MPSQPLSKRKKVAIVHPKVGWGGSEATVLWMITALKSDYDITLITSGRVDINGLNAYYGTSLVAQDFSVMQVPMPFILKNTSKFAALRGRFIQRYCQKVAPQFDIMIDSYSLCDFGVRAIQFATDIAPLPTILNLSMIKRAWYANTLLRKMYLGMCDMVSIQNPEHWKKNLTLSNSHWTASLLQQQYGVSSQVLYPPVPGQTIDLPYEKKEPSFVLIGRIVPEKKIEMAVEILHQVRQRGHQVTLHIIGGIGDNKYVKSLAPLLLRHHAWVFFEGKVSQENKKKILEQCRFGISCRRNEPFGIGVAEMVKAGCIVFVPDGGGQVEVVKNPKLIYSDIPSAVANIETVIASETLQRDLYQQLQSQVRVFSVEEFTKEIKSMVKNFHGNN